MRPTISGLLLVLPLLSACAGNPQPGDPGYPYNLSGRYTADFVVQGGSYRAAMDLSTAPGGALSGIFTIDQPTMIAGTVEGTVSADTVDFQMPYEMVQEGCAGVVTGRSAISVDGAGFEGPIRLDDSCNGEMEGTLTVRR